MNNRESYIFWELAYSFITAHGYRIIQLFEEQNELWLEKRETKQAPIVRLTLQELNWSNAMQRDIEFVAYNGENVRKQINRNQLDVLNIYISPFPPVDEYEFRLSKPFVYPDGNKTNVHSILLTTEKLEMGLRQISDRLGREIHFELSDDYSEQEVAAVKKEALEYAVKKVKAERSLFSASKPFFTYVLLVLQAAMFIWLEMHGGSTNTSTLIKYGAKVNYLISSGEWWRLLTPVFLHIGFTHLAMNSLALYFLGTTVERIFGNVRFLFLYLFAGVTGFIASFLFSSNLSAGASGAIFGCFGALLYFGIRYPKLFFRTMGINIIVVLGINLVFGFSATGVDNAGHLGGLTGGFLAAGIFHFPKQKNWMWQIVFLIVSIAIVGGALFYGLHSSAKAGDETSYLIVAQDYVKQEKYDQAYQVLEELEDNVSRPSKNAYFLLSFVEVKKGLLSDASRHLQQAIKLDPKFDEAYFNLALVNLEQHQLEEAKANAEKAASLEPKNGDYTKLVYEIRLQLESGGAE